MRRHHSLTTFFMFAIISSSGIALSGCSNPAHRTFDLAYHLSGRGLYGNGARRCGTAHRETELAKINACALTELHQNKPFYAVYNLHDVDRGLALNDDGQLFRIEPDVPTGQKASEKSPVKVTLCQSNQLVPDRQAFGLFLLTCE